MRSVITTVVLCLVVAAALAQPIRKSSYENMLLAASESLANQDYYNALDWYEKAYEERKEKELTLTIAQMHYYLRDFVKAERWYSRLIDRDKNNEFANERFDYGRILKMNGKYDDARTQFERFIAETTDEKRKTLAKNEVAGIALYRSLPEVTKGVKVENIGKNINTPSEDGSPTFAADGKTMFFHSLNTKEVIIVDEKNTDYHAKLYSAAYSDKGKEKGWGKPTVLDEKINRPGYHTTNPKVAPDGRRMYFTRSELNGNELKSSKIYWSEGGESGWNAPQEVQGVNGEYAATHPALGMMFSKEVLFFASDMPGGEGGMDLYYAPYKGNGVFGDPVSLGPKFNTPGEEITPFYIDGTLYFSSTGLPGIGGHDIFYSVWDGSAWGEPKNMGKAYNTSVDDTYFTIDKEGYNGFLVSNREGGRSLKSKTCCNDIYGFSIARIFADLAVGLFDEQKKGLTGGNVQLLAMAGGQPKPLSDKNNPEGNAFGFELDMDQSYMVVGSRDGYYPDTFQFNVTGLKESKTFEHRFFLKAKPVPPPVPEYETITTEKPFVLENILYDFNKDAIKLEAEQDLQVIVDLMTEYPDMKIEMGSHTDNRGGAQYNEDLSQRRAESARRWLTRKGIVRERIEAKGYGQGKPQTVTERVAAQHAFLKVGDVLSPAFIDALPNEEAKEVAHALNRRTEFRITAGPTSVTIKSTQLRKKEADEADKKVDPKAPQKKDQRRRNSNIVEPDQTEPAKKPAQTEPAKKPVTKAQSKGTKTTAPNKNGQPKKPAAKPAAKAASAQQPPVVSTLSSLYSKGRTDYKGVPILHVDKRVLDLGKVKHGDKRSFSYEFTNKGDTPLVISVATSCTCTTLDYSTAPVKPGGKSTIKVVFDSTEKEESETVDIDILLENEDPVKKRPIFETLQYKFELVK